MKDATQIQEILELKEWNDPRFEPLLTPNVWLKDANQIQEILNLPYWNFEKYQSLLVSSIWNKNAEQIVSNIEFCQKNGLEEYDNNPILILRLTKKELQAKINYLNYHEMPLYNEKGRIHSIFSMSNVNMQKRYGISKKELIKNYLNIEKRENHVLR